MKSGKVACFCIFEISIYSGHYQDKGGKVYCFRICRMHTMSDKCIGPRLRKDMKVICEVSKEMGLESS